MRLSLFSLLLSVGATAWAAINHRRARDLEIRLDNLRTSHSRLASHSREQHENLERELKRVRHQLRPHGGLDVLFQPDLTIEQALDLDPRAADVLSAFHIGGCSSCAVSPTETLEHAATANGQDITQLLAVLNRLGADQGEALLTGLERKPNVQLSL
jgi:hybrid cluster-associated redox disulfide protein